MDLTTRAIGGDLEEGEQGIKEEKGFDLPPEFCRYRDEGCELAGSCLECPFPRCLLEEPRGRQRWLKESRDREISRLYAEGKRVKELAETFRVSQRTIQRALKPATANAGSLTASKGDEECHE
jgi:hypothetical protein